MTCACGSVHRVRRQQLHQVQQCAACGDELFVLPVSPYPVRRPRLDPQTGPDLWNAVPRPGQTAAKGAAFRKRLTSALELPEGSIDVQPIDVEPLDEPRPPHAPRAEVPNRSVAEPDAVRATPALGSPPRPRPTDRPKRPLWRRPRLLMFLAGVLLAVTVSVPLWNRARERWAEAMRHHAAEGRQAYAEGDFATAKAELGEARRLMRRLQWPAGWLGRTSRYVRELRAEVHREDEISVEQAYREAVLCDDLLTDSLLDVARTAADWVQQAGSRDAKTQFERRYQGGAVIFETTISRATDGRAAFAAPLLLKVDEMFFRIDARELHLFERLQGDEPRRVLFGARLDTLAPADTVGREWFIRLQPSSGVLFTYEPTLERLGWTASRPFVVDPELATMIERQRVEVRGWSAD